MSLDLPFLFLSCKFYLELSLSRCTSLMQVLFGTLPIVVSSILQVVFATICVQFFSVGSLFIMVSIRLTCLICHGRKREQCLLCHCLFFWHTSTINAALFSCIACILFYWPSPGTVTFVLFSLHVCEKKYRDCGLL